MTLSEISLGRKYRLESLPKDNALARRLLDMGFCSGMEVSAVLKSRGLLELRIGETLVAVKAENCNEIVIYEDGQ